MSAIWTALGDFITGLFTAIGGVVTGISGEPIILTFVILLPLTAIALGYLFKFLGRKRKGRRG